MSPARVLVSLTVGLSACTLSPVGLEDRPCPCAEGWVCDEARDRCVEGQLDDAGSMDAGMLDAGPRLDAGALSDGSLDAGRDAAALDAGPAAADSGPIDAGPAPVDSVCNDHPGALFCDGFERGFDGWTDTFELSGTARVIATTPQRGTGALEVRTTAGRGAAFVTGRLRRPAIAGDEIHVRLHLWVPSTFSSNGVRFMAIGDSETPPFGFALGIANDGTPRLHLDALAREASTTAVEIQGDSWRCVQLRVDVADSGRLSASVDGSVFGEEADVRTTSVDGLQSISVGITASEDAESSGHLRIDEVLVTDELVACP